MLPATDKNLRNFGYVMGCAFLLVAGWVLFKSENPNRALFAAGLAGTGLVFAALGGAAPRSLVFLYKPWMGFAHYMGMVMTFVLMTLFFFTLLLPFTLIRLKDPLRLRLGRESYWEPHRNPEPTIERFRRGF